MKRAIAALALVSLAAALVAGLVLHRYLTCAPQIPVVEKVVRIERGSSFRKAANVLEAAGVITHGNLLTIIAPFLRPVEGIKAGEYRFDTPSSPLSVLDKLIRGEVITHKVTVPEGYTIAQIAALFEASSLADAVKVEAAASDPELVASLGLEGGCLEGCLFPDTYFFARGLRTREILSAMVGHHKTVFAEVRSGAEAGGDRAAGLSDYQILILASIIEKEAGVPAELPLVSAVFHNRLRRGIPLQSDPTVIYGMEDFNGNIRRRDLETPTPYNTYLKAGLPPTPIANPGRASIQAALGPAPVDYLYFVSRNDGTHQFSRTLKEHNEAVRIYQRRGRRR